MKQYEEYIARYCRNGRHMPEEAREQAICREVEKYYRDENKPVAAPLKHEFICCSES